MRAEKLSIHARYREHMGLITSLADFETSAAGALDAGRLLHGGEFRLYCLDHARGRAIFTALPGASDLSRAPFMYQAQFDAAEYLAALPFESFLRLAEDIPFDARRLVCLHNIARCGSTVLSRAFNEVDEVLSLSEPDALTNLVRFRVLPQADQIELLRASVAWLCRPAVVEDRQHVAIKFRNQAISLMRLHIDALPSATHLFMTRNVIDWLASFHRLRSKRGDPIVGFTRAQAIARQAEYMHCPPADIERYAHSSIETYEGLVERALGWIYMLDRYLELHQAGAPIQAIRYEDLQQRREATLRALLDRAGLPQSALPAMLRAFETDSQAGTRFARDDASAAIR